MLEPVRGAQPAGGPAAVSGPERPERAYEKDATVRKRGLVRAETPAGVPGNAEGQELECEKAVTV